MLLQNKRVNLLHIEFILSHDLDKMYSKILLNLQATLRLNNQNTDGWECS